MQIGTNLPKSTNKRFDPGFRGVMINPRTPPVPYGPSQGLPRGVIPRDLLPLDAVHCYDAVSRCAGEYDAIHISRVNLRMPWLVSTATGPGDLQLMEIGSNVFPQAGFRCRYRLHETAAFFGNLRSVAIHPFVINPPERQWVSPCIRKSSLYQRRSQLPNSFNRGILDLHRQDVYQKAEVETPFRIRNFAAVKLHRPIVSRESNIPCKVTSRMLRKALFSPTVEKPQFSIDWQSNEIKKVEFFRDLRQIFYRSGVV